jgi:hypothetical protein
LILNYQHCDMIGSAAEAEKRSGAGGADMAYVEAQAALMNQDENVVGLSAEGKRKLEAASDAAGTFKKSSSQTGFLKEVMAQGVQRKEDALALLAAQKEAAEKFETSQVARDAANLAAAQAMQLQTLTALGLMIDKLAAKF